MGYETAFMLGLLGGIHCLGMCGPLAAAQPCGGRTTAGRVVGRLVYNGGRITTYVILGLAVGAFGGVLSITPLQRGLSIAAGAALLGFLVLVLCFRGRWNPIVNIQIAVAAPQRAMSGLLRRRTPGSAYLLGLLNGLLPCGLVYVALAPALAMGSLARGALYMLVFGLGTLPAMLAAGLLGMKLQRLISFRPRFLVPAAGLAVAALLILRGMSLGIPYLSPSFGQGGASTCCPGHGGAADDPQGPVPGPGSSAGK